jgi:hypothetical protein
MPVAGLFLSLLLAIVEPGAAVVSGLISVGLLVRRVSARIGVVAALVCISPFLSRYSVDVAGVGIRMEMIAGVAAWISVLGRLARIKISPSAAVAISLLGAWWIVLLLATIYASPDPGRSLSIVVWLMLGFGIALFIGSDKAIADRVAQTLLYIALAFAIGASVLWIFAHITGKFGPGLQLDPTYGQYAVYATVYEANIFASLIVLTAILGVVVSGRNPVPRHALLLWALAPIVCVLAQTRAALLAWVLASLVLMVRRRAGRLRVAGLLGLSTLAWLLVSGLIASSGGLLDKMAQTIDFSSGTGRYRAASWQVALSDLRKIPDAWLGLGANSFSQRHIDPTLVAQREPWYLPNVFLQVPYDSGRIGLLLVGAAVLLVLARRPSSGGLALLLAYSVTASATSVLWLAQTWILAGLAFGLPAQSNYTDGRAHVRQST